MDWSPSGVKLVKRAETLLLFIAIAIIMWLAIAAWFQPLQFRVLAGDDLRAFARTQTDLQMGFGAEILHSAFHFHKVRPVTTWITSVITKWTKGDFREIASIGLAIHTANAMIFFLLLYRAIGLPLPLSAGMTVIAIFNRFATYLLMQEQAIMEGIGVAVFLLLLIASLSFLERPTIRRSLLLILLFALILNIHERYLVLILPLILLSAGSFSFNRRSSITLASGVTAIALSYLGVKKFVLGAPILVGTGTLPIEFDASQICSFVWHGALNLVGIRPFRLGRFFRLSVLDSIRVCRRSHSLLLPSGGNRRCHHSLARGKREARRSSAAGFLWHNDRSLVALGEHHDPTGISLALSCLSGVFVFAWRRIKSLKDSTAVVSSRANLPGLAVVMPGGLPGALATAVLRVRVLSNCQ
jgi:hypothetical protein